MFVKLILYYTVHHLKWNEVKNGYFAAKPIAFTSNFWLITSNKFHSSSSASASELLDMGELSPNTTQATQYIVK